MKKIVTALSLATIIIGLSACSPTQEVVVETKVGNITQDDFYQELKDANGTTVLQTMIEEKVLSAKFKVTDSEVQKEIDDVKKQFPSDEEFLSAITNYGIADEEAFKQQLKVDMLRFKATTDGVKVTDKKLKEYYETNKVNFQTVKAQHILVGTDKEAQDLKKKLSEGADFSKLATEFSLDTQSAEKGGDLGEFSKGDMVAEFEAVAFTIEPNVVSDIVKTDYGFHIIKVTERNQKNFEEVKDVVEKSYLNDNAKPYEEVMNTLKKEAKIEIKDEDLNALIKKLAKTTESPETIKE